MIGTHHMAEDLVLFALYTYKILLFSMLLAVREAIHVTMWRLHFISCHLCPPPPTTADDSQLHIGSFAGMMPEKVEKWSVCFSSKLVTYACIKCYVVDRINRMCARRRNVAHLPTDPLLFNSILYTSGVFFFVMVTWLNHPHLFISSVCVISPTDKNSPNLIPNEKSRV